MRLVRRTIVAGLVAGPALVLMLLPASAAASERPEHPGWRAAFDAGPGRVQAERGGAMAGQQAHHLTRLAAGRAPVRDVGAPGPSGEPGSVTEPEVTDAGQTTATVGAAARPGHAQRRGNVVAVFEDPADPLIVLEVENGYVTVRLRCGALCPSIHRGDYVIAEGRRRSEAVFDAEEVWVVAP